MRINQNAFDEAFQDQSHDDPHVRRQNLQRHQKRTDRALYGMIFIGGLVVGILITYSLFKAFAL